MRWMNFARKPMIMPESIKKEQRSGMIGIFKGVNSSRDNKFFYTTHASGFSQVS